MKLSLCLALAIASPAFAQIKAVIDDPDGYVNVRSGRSVDAPVVVKVKTGEVFTFRAESDDPRMDWFPVKLASGKSGWMHRSRIVFHFTEKDLPKKMEKGDELGDFARARGIDYVAVSRAAAKGDPKALKTYFGITDTDGAAAETHFVILPVVFHLVGDDRFAAFLSTQPLDYQMDVRRFFAGGEVTSPFPAVEYLRRHFPKTAQIFFRHEFVDWPSPDGKYAIRKVIANEDDLVNGKVERAELIEKGTGEVVADLSRDDHGQGLDREGNVLWAYDSRRFVFYSTTDSVGTAVVYQQGDSGRIQRVELPIEKLPGMDTDEELKGAKKVHSFAEPKRWTSATSLYLERNDYLQSVGKSGEIHDIGRLYRIDLEVAADGTATIKKVDVEK